MFNIPTEFVVVGLIILAISNVCALLLGIYLEYRSTKGQPTTVTEVEYVTDPELVQRVQLSAAELHYYGYVAVKIVQNGKLSFFWLRKGEMDEAWYAVIDEEGHIQFEDEPWSVIGFGQSTIMTSPQGYTYIPSKNIIINDEQKSIPVQIGWAGFNGAAHKVKRTVDHADPTLIM